MKEANRSTEILKKKFSDVKVLLGTKMKYHSNFNSPYYWERLNMETKKFKSRILIRTLEKRIITSLNFPVNKFLKLKLKSMNDSKFQVEIDNIKTEEWNNLITLFDDVTIFQTWEYGEKNSMHLSHIVLKYEDEVVACAQVRIFKPPILKAGIAYINHGPLWIRKNNKNIDVLKKIATVLIEEYVKIRKLYLKVNLEYENTDSDANDIMDTFIEIGYIKKEHNEQHVILPLNNSIEELRKGLDQKWRNQLNIADRNSLEIIEGYEDQYIIEFSKIFKSMIFQKKFAKPESIDGFIERI